MKKLIVFLLLVSLLFNASISTQAKTIKEILIVGLSRTDQNVVRSQLPFKEGDEWKEELGLIVSINFSNRSKIR